MNQNSIFLKMKHQMQSLVSILPAVFTCQIVFFSEPIFAAESGGGGGTTTHSTSSSNGFGGGGSSYNGSSGSTTSSSNGFGGGGSSYNGSSGSTTSSSNGFGGGGSSYNGSWGSTTSSSSNSGGGGGAADNGHGPIGSTTSTSNSSKSGSTLGGYVNTGNNPGNSTAPGYGNGGVSSYGDSQTAKEAKQAGYTNQVNGIGGTIGAGTTGYDQAIQRGYYSGVQNYYDSKNVPAIERTVPTGPMGTALGGALAASDEYVAEIDRLFRQGSIAIADIKHGATLAQVRDIIGPSVYDNLPAYSKFGLDTHIVIAGLTGHLIGARWARYDRDLHAVLIDTTNPADIGLLTPHEGVHAADDEIYDRAIATLNDPNATAQQKQRADYAVSALKSIMDQSYYSQISDNINPASSLAVDSAAAPRQAVFREYLSRLEELHGYSVDQANKDAWARNYERYSGVSKEEALGLINEYSGYIDNSSIEAFASTQPEYKK